VASYENGGLMNPPAGELSLRSGLLALSQIITGVVSLEDTLTHVARITVQSVHGADGVGIALTPERRGQLTIASEPFVREVDTIQYELGQGPAVSAVADDRVFRSGSLATDRRWPKFAARVANLGVNRTQSTLSLPLRLPGRVIGSLNVYARGEDTFDDDSIRRGEVFSAAAAVAISNMQNLDLVQRQASHLEEALIARATIDQAVGIIRSRSGATADEAMDAMRQMSQHDNRKISEVAERLVDQAIDRARSRHRTDHVRSATIRHES
jgi:GAF domain-containing protein